MNVVEVSQRLPTDVDRMGEVAKGIESIVVKEVTVYKEMETDRTVETRTETVT